MFGKILFSLLVLATICGRSYLVDAKQDDKDALTIADYECEGKDAANITQNQRLSVPANCDPAGIIAQDDDKRKFIVCNGNTKKVVSVKVLAHSAYPAGAYVQAELLFEALSGPLEGKYIYMKVIHLVAAYLKKCSSVLGYSYLSSKSDSLLISDRLDANVLLSPNGGYEQFKKGCTTVCNGRMYVI